MRKSWKDTFVIGFALFSMFFGAGNVIFPPYLGLGCGREWLLGFLCYYLADIGLALVALFAILKGGGSESITQPLGRVPSAVLMSAIVLCIGPMLAIPRTAATTYEMSVLPLAAGFSPALFSALFFLVILLLCLRESAVVDIVGRFLTPALLIGLLILIVKGVVSPIGSVPDRVLVDNVVRTGIEAGYQTMDVLAAMVFGIIVLNSAREKGHTETKAQYRVVAGAGIIAGTVLLVVYLGLTYLGVTMSEFFNLSVLRTYLMVAIVRNLLGHGGIFLFSIVVALACVTTAVALVSSSAAFFSELSKGKLPYKALVAVICVFSAVVSNIGLEQIVSIAAPVLELVYPPTLVLIVLAFFRRWLPEDLPLQLAAAGALLYSGLSFLRSCGVPMEILDRLPLSSFGFGWMAPAIIGLLLGVALCRTQQRSA